MTRNQSKTKSRRGRARGADLTRQEAFSASRPPSLNYYFNRAYLLTNYKREKERKAKKGESGRNLRARRSEGEAEVSKRLERNVCVPMAIIAPMREMDRRGARGGIGSELRSILRHAAVGKDGDERPPAERARRSVIICPAS